MVVISSASKAYETPNGVQKYPLTNNLEVRKIPTHPDMLDDLKIVPFVLTLIHLEGSALQINFIIFGACRETYSIYRCLSTWNLSTLFRIESHYDKFTNKSLNCSKM